MTAAHKGKGGKFFGVLGVLANFGIARIAPRAGVRRLVCALESQNEDTSMAAYMALVKLGPKYAREVLQSSGDRPPSVGVLQVLGDMGDTELIPRLESLARSKDEKRAAAAHDSIEALREIENE